VSKLSDRGEGTEPWIDCSIKGVLGRSTMTNQEDINIPSAHGT